MANAHTPKPSVQEVVGIIDRVVKKEFESNKRILSFDEYLALLSEQPEKQLRGSARYITDMMDFFGKYSPQVQDAAVSPQRFRIFDWPIDGIAPKVVGNETTQHHIYRVLQTFHQQKHNNKLILLHGPNGSAKTSIIHSIMSGIEKYSHESDGAAYMFNWIFPVERYTKSSLGIGPYSTPKETLQTYAKLPDEDVAARIPCDLNDHPFLIIPQEHRRHFLEKLIGEAKVAELWDHLPNYLTKGDLCHRCKEIFEALLVANGGDLRKILMHTQVERLYFARRYRTGLVTIEPQLHVDAQYQLLTYNKSIMSLPASLLSINLFTLTGDLVDGNRGLIEYSDLLKRPVDSFKYLLGACETGSVNVGSTIAHFDVVMLGSTNEIQLDSFKEFPDFTSFKARIELVRVPYLLSITDEREIYDSQIQQFSGEKHIAPHAGWAVSLWAILTRLKKPNSINYPPSVNSIVSNMTPLEKARLYDNGELSSGLSAEDRKLLRANLKKLKDEYLNVPYYEGRIGASAREVKSLLFEAAQNPDYSCLSPLSILREIEEFVKRVTEYEFLKQDVKDGFHDVTEFINIVRSEYISIIDREVRDCMGIYDFTQWENFLKRYIQNISLVLKKEKIKNQMTGKLEDPDITLIEEFEKIVGAPDGAVEKDAFRQNIISQIGAWSLDHPKEQVVYAKVFTDFWKKLENHYFEDQKARLTQMHDAVLVYDTDDDDPTSEGGILARNTMNNMKSRLGYCEKCAKEVITFLMRQKY
ncbi:MAG: serine protein kinase PrkA [Bdellovibrionota bacterium]